MIVKSSFFQLKSLITSLIDQIFILFCFIWIIIAGIYWNILKRIITLYDCEIIIILYPVPHVTIHFLLRSVYLLFHVDVYSKYAIVWYTRFDVNIWWFTCFDLFIDPISLYYSNVYVIYCFKRSRFSVRLYNDYFDLVCWLILYLLKSVCFLFHLKFL